MKTAVGVHVVVWRRITTSADLQLEGIVVVVIADWLKFISLRIAVNENVGLCMPCSDRRTRSRRQGMWYAMHVTFLLFLILLLS